jgi:transposase
MVMSLSRSRARFVYFTNQPVTTWFLIRAHEEAFAYFEGIPQEIIYDQDSTTLVDENSGELIFTRSFGAYVLNAVLMFTCAIRKIRNQKVK